MTPTGPLILYRRDLPVGAQRFAIAHGIAHLIFDFVNDKSIAPLNDPFVEKRADDFAAELLVPLSELAPMVSRWPEGTEVDPDVDREIYLDQVDEIASCFNVPPLVIDGQIRKLPRI